MKPLRIVKASQTTDIAHIIQPSIEALLQRCDAVIVSPLMGLDQFKQFGPRVIVDCQDYLGLGLRGKMAQMAADLGLSSIVCLCPHDAVRRAILERGG